MESPGKENAESLYATTSSLRKIFEGIEDVTKKLDSMGKEQADYIKNNLIKLKQSVEDGHSFVERKTQAFNQI